MSGSVAPPDSRPTSTADAAMAMHLETPKRRQNTPGVQAESIYNLTLKNNFYLPESVRDAREIQYCYNPNVKH